MLHSGKITGHCQLYGQGFRKDFLIPGCVSETTEVAPVTEIFM